MTAPDFATHIGPTTPHFLIYRDHYIHVRTVRGFADPTWFVKTIAAEGKHHPGTLPLYRILELIDAKLRR